ncbi:MULTISPECIES: VOC family protein [unclassified Shinella]|uniref:VOC family protein n=1 Tax=unclassified Shinella TaxID=2643062 RepID=UPI00234EA8C9|nr:VOC family protein [Shinella sp. YE25]MDC7259430.1 glyoxalase [Shinella sp. YE25]
MVSTSRVVAVVPCNNIEASLNFYGLLGFNRDEKSSTDDYAILSDGMGGFIHLSIAPKDWLVPGRNPFGIYIYTQDVDNIASKLGERLAHQPKKQPWGMYEFAVSDPDENLVRIGCEL